MADDSTFTGSDLDNTPAHYRQLRSLVHAIAISVIILTGTVFIFIYREVVLIRRQTSELVGALTGYDRTNTVRLIEGLRIKLGDYSKDHPDFVPIYTRYFGTNAPPVATPNGLTPIPTNATTTNGKAKK